jgi:hypothetical protein
MMMMMIIIIIIIIISLLFGAEFIVRRAIINIVLCIEPHTGVIKFRKNNGGPLQ